MQLPEDCRLAYVVGAEAWYARSDPSSRPYVSVMAAADGGGAAWEFQVEERDDVRPGTVQVQAFDDAFDAFVQVPEFFAALAEQQPSSLAAVVAILNELGARDDTQRANPYASKAEGQCERCGQPMRLTP